VSVEAPERVDAPPAADRLATARGARLATSDLLLYAVLIAASLGLALGLAAALLTAFYMTRMMLYTFHGPNRTGEKEREHLHEAPWVMTGPLVVLGVLSLAGGALNLPRLVGGNAWLEHWLEPVTSASAALLPATDVSPGTEWTLIAVAVVIALAGLVGAVQLLAPAALLPARQAPADHGFGKVLANKWYVDELYDRVVVKPIGWLSRVVLWKGIDQGVIDGAGVNGSGAISRALGWVGSKLQTGEVGFYVVLFVLGVALVLRAAIR